MAPKRQNIGDVGIYCFLMPSFNYFNDNKSGFVKLEQFQATLQMLSICVNYF